MKEYVLSYYPEFSCLKGECAHTCCAGWEIYIDEDTLKLYKDHGGDFKEALKKGINFKKSAYKSVNGGKCAFLNGDGLCDIILNLGESCLCRICRDHPRFKSFLSDRTETGLGFCCEAAAKIILSHKNKITLIKTADDGEKDCLDFNESNILAFREEALNIIQDRKTPINGRIDALLKLSYASLTQSNLDKCIKLLRSLERLDKGWGKRIKALSAARFEPVKDDLAIYCEQFLVNSFYRHLPYAEDTFDVRARTVACILFWHIIQSIVLAEGFSFNNLSDVVRAFSAEVEYSTENLEKLFAFSRKLVKI